VTKAPDSSTAAQAADARRPAGGPVTIAAVGDTMLGNTPDLPPDPAAYLEPVKSELTGGAQIVFGNLEGTLTSAEDSKCGSAGSGGTCFAFRDPPGYIDYYKAAGFTILNDANNHSMDFGPAGLTQTARTIHGAGLAQTGLPGEITVVTANGTKVAFVAFAHMAVDSGASLVLASGPHVLRGMQFYHGHLIAYSLGNFAGYSNFGTTGELALSAILHVTLSGTGQYQRGRLYPLELTSQNRPTPGGDTTSFVAQLSREDFGATAAQISARGVIQAP
jgi:hypothetical protein